MMRTEKKSIAVLLLVTLVLAATAFAADAQSTPATAVPRLVNYSGKILDKTGQPAPGIAGVSFAIYKDEEGGTALWMETQNVTADKAGHYTAPLGTTKPAGLPLELFTASEARWLGVTVNGGAEQPRVLLLSVPYALRAADAETLGGKPASAYMIAPASGGKAVAEQANEIVCTSATGCKTGSIPLFTTTGGSSKVGNSILTQTGTTIKVTGNQTVTGVQTVTGNENVTGSLGVSGGIVASGNMLTNGTLTAYGNTPGPGVHGYSTGSIYPGVYGTNAAGGPGVLGSASGIGGQGVFGQSSGTTVVNGFAPDGVHGIANSTVGSGVAGVNLAAGGTGVYGSGDIGFATANNVQQARSAGGWVKAMALVTPGGISQCFNSTLAGSAANIPPCGFGFSNIGTGDYVLDFGFEVDDRIMSATTTHADVTIAVCTDGIPCNASLTANQVEVTSYAPTQDHYFDSKFYLIVF